MRVFLEMSRSSWGEMSRHGCFQAQASVPVGGEGEEESSCSMRLCIEWEVRPPSPDAARPGLGGYTSTVTLQGQSQSWPDPQGPRGLWGQGRSLQGSHSSSRGVFVCVCVCVCVRACACLGLGLGLGPGRLSRSKPERTFACTKCL